MRKVYGCVVSRDDHYVRIEGGKFNAAEFEEHPERYASTFSHKVSAGRHKTYLSVGKCLCLC